MGAARVKFAGVGIGQPGLISGEFYDGDLHAKAQTQIRDRVRSGVLGGKDHPLDAPAAEAAGHQNSVQGGKFRLCDCFRVDPVDLHAHLASVARVPQRLCHGEIGVVKLYVFAHQADPDRALQALDPRNQCGPLSQIRLRRREAQLPANHPGETRLLQHQRRLIEHRQGAVFQHAVGLYVAEQGDFLEDALLQRLVAAQDDDIRADAHALQLLDRVLGGLGLVLLGAVQVRH